MLVQLSNFVNYLCNRLSYFKNSNKYLCMLLDFFNSNLAVPISTVQKYMSIDVAYLPEPLNYPVNFIVMLLFAFLAFLTFTNNFLCNLVAISYPLYYGLQLYSNLEYRSSETTALGKYWMIYGAMTFVENFVGFILSMVPGYYYFKMVILYCLMRNNFYLSTNVFTVALNYYRQFIPRVEPALRTRNKEN